MRKPILIIFTNALILVVVFMLLAQSLFVVQRLAQAQNVGGRVEVQRHGQGNFKALANGVTVAVGDIVRTGSDGKVEFTWADRTRWKLMPNTTLTVQKADFDAGKHIGSARFRLESGKVLVRTIKSLAPTSSFEIETPTALANVRDSVFSIAANIGQTQIEVWKGNVQLTQRCGGAGVVKSGQQAVAKGKTIKITAAPATALPAPADLLRPELDVDVQPVKGTSAFLRGSTEAGDKVHIDGKVVSVLGNGIFFKPVTLAAGHNEWIIKSTDSHGETTSVCRSLEFDAETQKTQAGTCSVE